MRLLLSVLVLLVGVAIVAGGIFMAVREEPIDAETRQTLNDLMNAQVRDLSSQIDAQVQEEASALEPNETRELAQAAVEELVGDVADEIVLEAVQADVSLENESDLNPVARAIAARELESSLPGTTAQAVVDEIADTVASEVPTQIGFIKAQIAESVIDEIKVPLDSNEQISTLVSRIVDGSIIEAAESGVSLDSEERVEAAVDRVLDRNVEAAEDELLEVDIADLKKVLREETTSSITQLQAQVEANASEDIDFNQLEDEAATELSDIADGEVEKLIEDATDQVVTELAESGQSPDDAGELVQSIVDQQAEKKFGSADVEMVLGNVERAIDAEVEDRSDQIIITQNVDDAGGSSFSLMPTLISVAGTILVTFMGTNVFQQGVSSLLTPVRASIGDDPREQDPKAEVEESGKTSVTWSFKIAYAGTEETILEEIRLHCEGAGYRSKTHTGRGGMVKVTNVTDNLNQKDEPLPLLIPPGKELLITATCTGQAQKWTGTKVGNPRVTAIDLKLGDRWRMFAL